MEEDNINIWAAFDVGSGATKMTCCSVLVKEDDNIEIVSILYSKQVEVLVGNSLRAAEDGKTIPQHILYKLEAALKELKSEAVKRGAIKFAGIATQAFREACNGENFLKQLEDNYNICLHLISQEEEGRLGFLSALSGAHRCCEEDLIAWDSGGASFQVTTLQPSVSSLFVMEGPWGSSNVTSTMVERIQGHSFKEVESVNPTTECDTSKLLTLVKSSLVETPGVVGWLKDKVRKEKTQVIAIGGETCMFQMAHLVTEKYDFSREDVWSAISLLTGKTDEELKGTFLQAGMLIPKLVLFVAVCDILEMGERRIHYHPTNGSTSGIILSSKYWK